MKFSELLGADKAFNYLNRASSNVGLRGLPGLNRVSDEERQAFKLANDDKLKQFMDDPELYNQAAEILYNNRQFKNVFGEDTFNALNDGTEDTYNYRNELLKNKVIDDEWNRRFNPISSSGTRDNKVGLGADWEKYNEMSPDAKLKVLESDYRNTSEVEKSIDEFGDKNIINRAAMGLLDFVGLDEALKEHKKGANNKIIESIYNDDIDERTKKLSYEVAQAYMDPSIANLSDSEVKKAFIKAITPGSYIDERGIPNRGIAEYAAQYGDGTGNLHDLDNFTIDDMRQVLAKKAVYDRYMSPDMAATALNNEAKRYIKEQQSTFEVFGKFANDLKISVLSYLADKANGIWNLGLLAADKFGDKPIVWVDDTGNVVHPKEKEFVQTRDGGYGYYDEKQNFHPVHQAEIARTTLRNMGKDTDGSTLDSPLDPVYWTKAEQFGTMDEEEQAQYEKLGTSPYKVMWDPNEDSNLWYEAFKMMSFGIADAVSMLIPFGVGAAGKALSTASKTGKVISGLGDKIYKGSKFLTYETKAGQIAQGTAGALGIAYAYQRGSFQETLAKNLADAESAALELSKKEVSNQYDTDKDYRKQVDTLINARAAEIKSDYLLQAQQEGTPVTDTKSLDASAIEQAKNEVMGDLVQRRFDEKKASGEYAKLEDEAINSAGDAAVDSFLPEAIKYSLVNNLGYRKFLYQNPAGLAKRVSKSLKGLTEVDKRLVPETSKFATWGQKTKQFGRVLGSQAWGGAWTNGTDDMMVDAAERINADSYARYLNNYANGEAFADTYGFADWMYSYWHGMMNSLGQDTTWNAAAVGGLGSIVSATPNMVNIAHFFTKEGKEAFKNTYSKKPVFENGKFKRDEQGRIVTEDLGWKDNWLERINYFVQNGVLNTYFSKKANERQLQSHADYVNRLLDEEEDFKVLDDLVAADIAASDPSSVENAKTTNFAKALRTMVALDRMGESSEDPTTLSSVVQNAKTLIDRLANQTDENGESTLSEEETKRLLETYYAVNNTLDRNDENNQAALQHISKNARTLKEAYDAYQEANKETTKIEEDSGNKISDFVRDKMNTNQAMTKHWENRLGTMRSEINDMSDIDGELSDENVLPVAGGVKGANALVSLYDTQVGQFEKVIAEQNDKIAARQEAYDNAKKNLEEAEKTEDSDTIFGAMRVLDISRSALEDAKQQAEYYNDMLSMTKEKSNKIKNALSAHEKEGGKVKVLTADEIFALDPISRARMMDPDRRSLYTKQQQREITKLEQRLQGQDGALQKIQDIALLIQRINTNRDAYNRIAKNPRAAEARFDEQRVWAAKEAYKLINRRNAKIAVDFINTAKEKLKGRADVKKEDFDNFVYKVLRTLNTNLLDIIDSDGLLPSHTSQIQDAKSWGKLLSDITSIVDHSNKEDAWKKNVFSVVDTLAQSTNSREAFMDEMERVIDTSKSQQAIQDFEYLLESLKKLGYQRSAIIAEEREKRKKREEEEKKRSEEAKKKLNENTQAAAKNSAEKKKEEVAKTQEEKNKERAAANQRAEQQINTAAVDAVTPAEYAAIVNMPAGNFTAEDAKKNLKDEVLATIKYLNHDISASDYLFALGDMADHTPEETTKLANELAAKYDKYINKPSTTNSKEELNKNRPEGPVSNRIVVGHENGDGASIITPVNDGNRRMAFAADHASYSAKGALDSRKNKRTEQLQGVDIYTVERSGNARVSVVVFSHKDFTPSSRGGQGGYTFTTWRALTNAEKARVRDFFNNRDSIEGVFRASNNINDTAAALSKVIDDIMTSPDTVSKAPKAPEAKPQTQDNGRTIQERVVNSLRDWYLVTKKHITFDKKSHTYYIDGEPVDFSVSEYYQSVFGKPKIEGDYTHSLAIGNTIDAICRDFFDTDKNGVKKKDVSKISYPNLDDARKKEIISDLQALEKYLDESSTFGKDEHGNRLYKTITFEFPIAAKMKLPDGTKTIAGTVDMLIVDRNGDIHILDFKAKKNSIDSYNNRRDYTAQQNLYRAILNTIMPEANIRSLNLLWWDTNYPGINNTTYKTDDNGNITVSENGEKAIPIAEYSKFSTPSLKENVEKSVIPLAITNTVANLTIPKMEPIEVVQEEQERKGVEAASSGAEISTESTADVVEGENGETYIPTPSAKEQVKESPSPQDVIVQKVDQLENFDTSNSTEELAKTDDRFLSANAIPKYEDKDPEYLLRDEGILKRQRGDKEGDSMNRYFEWMDSFVDANGTKGTDLQNIIDTELHKILKAKPNLKVKFMIVNPQNNATHDDYMETRLMLAVDYDSDIDAIHNKENGGVIKSGGNKYLMIGYAGYGKKIESDVQNETGRYGHWFRLFSKKKGLARRGMDKFFKDNPSERFYVSDKFSTEIVPNSLIPGWIVKQREDEKWKKGYRPISELLKENNLNWRSFGWGIQTAEDDLVTTYAKGKVMSPSNPMLNRGRAFILIPAANGKFVPSYIKPLMYREMKDGALKNEIQNLLRELVAPLRKGETSKRLDTRRKLSNIFYFTDSENNILYNKDKDILTLVSNGQKIHPDFNLRGSVDFMEFMKAFETMNPRINITLSVFQNKKLLDKYDEAGALQTDISMLRTAGSSYSIFPLDAKGDIMKSNDLENHPAWGTTETKFKKEKKQVVYNEKYYLYDRSTGKFSLIEGENSKEISNDALIRELNFNLQIADGERIPSEITTTSEFYVMREGEHPIVIEVNTNTKKAKRMSEDKAQALITRLTNERKERERKEAARQALEESIDNATDELIFTDEELTSGELLPTPTTQQSDQTLEEESREDKQEEEKKKEKKEETPTKKQIKGASQDFSSLMSKKKFKNRVYQILSKWPDSPIQTDEKGRILGAPSKDDIANYLRSKDVEIDAIGSSETAMQAWVDTLDACR